MLTLKHKHKYAFYSVQALSHKTFEHEHVLVLQNHPTRKLYIML
jgi:hypothetical protein